MKKLRIPFILPLFILTSCKNYIDINTIEEGQHSLRYFKGNQTLVDGKVVRKTHDGKLLN